MKNLFFPEEKNIKIKTTPYLCHLRMQIENFKTYLQISYRYPYILLQINVQTH